MPTLVSVRSFPWSSPGFGVIPELQKFSGDLEPRLYRPLAGKAEKAKWSCASRKRDEKATPLLAMNEEIETSSALTFTSCNLHVGLYRVRAFL